MLDLDQLSDPYQTLTDAFSSPEIHHHGAVTHDISLHSRADPNTIIDSDGKIYRHTADDFSNTSGNWLGWVEHNSVYNWHHDYLGHSTNDGRVLDAQDHLVGWVDNHGHVYNSAGVEVAETQNGVAGAAAYLLCVYHGNIP